MGFEIRHQLLAQFRAAADQTRKQGIFSIATKLGVVRGSNHASGTEDQGSTGRDIPFVLRRQREGDVIETSSDTRQLIGD